MKIIARILLGLTFIVSGVLKMISIYDFELYLFSFGLFSLDFSSLLARLIIGVEMALGVGYIFNRLNKFFYRSILYTLITFSFFLIYLFIVGRDDNCHCFGELVSLDPMMSIIKNLILIALLIYTKNVTGYHIPLHKNIMLPICAVVAIVPIVINPPDKIGSFNYVPSTIDKEAFDMFVASNVGWGLGSSVKMLCFYSSSCHYCKLSAQKISYIVENNGLNEDKILTLFWGDENAIPFFYEETKSKITNYKMIDVMEFLTITEGSMPIIVLFDDDGSTRVYDYRTIDEKVIVEMLK